MPARHAVLLTPLECTVPIIILYSKQRQPITPLECAVPEKTGEGAHSFHSGNSPPQANARGHSFTLSGADRRFRPCRKGPLITRHNSQVLSFHSLPHSFPVNLRHSPNNPCGIKCFRTLCRHNGGAYARLLPFAPPTAGEGALGSDSPFPHPHPLSRFFPIPLPPSPYPIGAPCPWW